jgi:hypothetical protein
MFTGLRIALVIAALYSPAAAYVGFIALRGGGFGGDFVRELGIGFILWQLVLSLLFVAPP